MKPYLKPHFTSEVKPFKSNSGNGPNTKTTKVISGFEADVTEDKNCHIAVHGEHRFLAKPPGLS